MDEELPEPPLLEEPDPEPEPAPLVEEARGVEVAGVETLEVLDPLALGLPEAETCLEAKPLTEWVAATEGPAEGAAEGPAEAEPEEPAEVASEPEEAEAEGTELRLGFVLPVEEGSVDELELLELGHFRSKSGLSVKDWPTMPKLGLAPTSWRMYHQVLVLSNSEQPTSSQKVLALATEATASFSLSPLTGQPVSVIQTGLPRAADLVLSTAS